MNWLIFLILGLCSVQFLADFSGKFNIAHGVPIKSEVKLPYNVTASSYDYSPGTTITSKLKLNLEVNIIRN